MAAADGRESLNGEGGSLVRRHRLSTRIWHWLNAVTLFVLLTSGLGIFNAHPHLYWGEYGANRDPAWLDIGSTRSGEGRLTILRTRVETTGVLGVWTAPDGSEKRRAFPHWATLPSSYSLADSRIWHLAFAWILAVGLLGYLVLSLVNRHIVRDLRLRLADLRPSHLWQEIIDHARLRFPTGQAALRYNTLQKIAYVAVLFGLLPVMIATGLAMAPGMDAAWPWLTEIWGGRQTARSVHFIAAFALVVFFLVHIAMVVLAGPINEVRSMITGWYRLPEDRA